MNNETPQNQSEKPIREAITPVKNPNANPERAQKFLALAYISSIAIVITIMVGLSA